MKRPDGTTQVTYAGFPLYRYSGDKKPGDVKGQGFQGVWHAVTSAGTLAKASGVDGRDNARRRARPPTAVAATATARNPHPSSDGRLLGAA